MRMHIMKRNLENHDIQKQGKLHTKSTTTVSFCKAHHSPEIIK